MTADGWGAARWAAVDRRVATMAVLASVVLVVTTLGLERSEWGSTALVWSLAGLLLPLLLAVSALLVTTASEPVVRWLCTTFTLLQLALVLTWPVARLHPEPGADVTPWVWLLEPAAVGLAAVVWPWRAAVLYAPLPAIALPVALYLADGQVSREVVARSCIHFGNVAFVAILVTARRQLALLWTVERQAEESELALVRATAAGAEQARLAAVVHDEVLATLVGAMQRTGPPGPALAAQAARALAVLDAPVGGDADPGRDLVPARMVAERVEAVVRVVAPRAGLAIVADGPDVPARVWSAVEAALGEALRNSVRHAGGAGRSVHRQVLLTVDQRGLRVEVQDDGRGFDLAAVPATRLGVAGSVLARLRSVPGGSAEIRSAPGEGTRVLLGWQRP
ncbi:MAG TPA: ATP-binding protein [Cellulomonas sp.]